MDMNAGTKATFTLGETGTCKQFPEVEADKTSETRAQECYKGADAGQIFQIQIRRSALKDSLVGSQYTSMCEAALNSEMAHGPLHGFRDENDTWIEWQIPLSEGSRTS
jgi:hypothetical protein